MGVDKSMLDYHGQSQARFLYDLLSEFCADVFVSTRRDQFFNEPLNYLQDQFEIFGPMNGILSALTMQPNRAWLIVAVDMPNVSTDVVEFLLSNRDPVKLATCFFNNAENFPEPLLTIWEPAALPELTRFVEGGEKSPRKFLSNNEVRLVQPRDPSILLNINSPEEFKQFKSRPNTD
jgi:molybdenum cofactor guanylyltransferase